MPHPRSLTFVCIILFSLFVFNLVGAINVYERLEFLSALPLATPPLYLLARDAFWAAVFLVMSVSLWRLFRWVRWASLAAVALYMAHGWLDRLMLARAEYVTVTQGWGLGVDIVLLLFVAWALFRRKTAQAFTT
ncbi:MAG: hypothetical protein JNL09_02840 [Anaerolineales bacterium]|nr:hypothetical protein [Anaerolineales bacterium]